MQGSPGPAAGLLAVLESDYRQLANDARKSEGFASFFSNADSQPEVKEAAERAVMKIRSLADHPNALDQIRASKDLLRPLQLSCDTKSARLISQSLATVQKMVSNDALSPAGADASIEMLAKVERSGDEGVQLKVLQTALTLLQSPMHPATEEGIAAVLGLCFRALTQKGRRDTVASTAAATVRQSVAIVFAYVDVGAEVARMERVRQRRAEAEAGGGSPDGSDADGNDPPAPAVAAARKLLEDLIAIATGAPPTWLHTQSLPRTFILEVLDFALANSPALFTALPDFQTALSLRISQLLQSQLQDHLDAGAAGAAASAAAFPAFRATLRCVRTLLVRYHAQLGVRCGTLIQTMLRGLGAQHPLPQRVAVALLVRQLLEDAPLVYFLFVQYDMQRERKLDAVYALVSGASDIVDAALRPPGGEPGGGGGAAPPDGAVGADAIGAMFQARSQNKEWNMDADYEAAPPAAQATYLAVLALDALLHFMASVEVLTYAATEGGGELRGGDWYALSPRERMVSGSPRAAAAAAAAAAGTPPPPPLAILRDPCAALVERTWRATLAVLTQLLARSTTETLVLSLLKGYQWFTQACGVLELPEARDAFLGALCHLALSSDGDAGAGVRAAAATSPRGAGGDADAGGAGGSPRSPPRRESFGGGGLGSPNRSASMDDVDGGIVLTPKNVQAMRTLFNVAHRLSGVLGPEGWALVLETLNTLDRVLNSPKTTTAEGGGASAGGGGGGAAAGAAPGHPLSSDLAILSAAAAQLFECTRDMSREAVVALLSGLRDVSLAHLPHATAVSQPRMYALGRMVEVLLCNVGRIYDLWGIFLAHVLEMVETPNRPVRAGAIDALGRAIIGALAGLPPAAGGGAAGGADGSPAPSPGGAGGESTGGLEHMLLVALEALHNDERERDVRVGVLRVLLAVLQRHGERLTDGWTPVFRLLAVVPAQEDPETMALAFQSLQLAAADYMPAMPFARLKKCLEVAVAYGKQQTDLNVSLTTISLLWNVGDMLSRSGAEGGGGGGGGAARRHRRSASALSAGGAGDGEEPSPGGRGAPGQLLGVTTPGQAEDLLELIFSALQALSQDPRPEVRNSGARTLFAVVVTQGPRLSRRLWERSLWELLFPLLRHSFHMSATSSREEAEAGLLGRSRGNTVRLVMHHSRNTEQKQWDETVVVAVGGMGRLLRAHLPAIAAMEGMEAGWEELMVVAESSLAGGRKEVAVAAVGLLGSVLGAHGGDDTVVTPAMWARAMRALDVGVEAATSAGCLVPLSARTELVALVGGLYSSLRPRFSEEDTLAVFRWTEAFCRNPWSEDDASNPVQAVGMPPVQKAALAALPGLAPDHLPGLWPAYVASIARLVQPAHVVAAWREQEEAAAAAVAAAAAEGDAESGGAGHAGGAGLMTPQRPMAPPQQGLGATPGPLGTGANGSVQLPAKQAQYRFALNSAFVEKAIALLVQVYASSPAWVRAVTLADVVEALGKCMELRFTVYQEKLWRCAAAAFNQLIPEGLPAVAAPLPLPAAGDPAAAAAVARCWPALAATLENFLLGESYRRGHPELGSPRGDGGDGGGGAPAATARAAAAHHAEHPQLPVVPVLEVPSKTAASLARRGAKKAVAAPPPPRPPAEAAAPDADPAQSRADVDLELSVLDTLTDAVLAGCGPAPPPLKRRLLSIVDRGIARPRALSIPQTATGSNFSHVCVRKMYVLCSRPGGGAGAAGAAGPEDTPLTVARLALPLFLARCDAMLRGFAEEARPGALGDGPPVARPRLDEVMCVLEVVASMALAPAVVDSVLVPEEPVAAVVGALRARPEVAARGRERTHLLLLYSALCGCITCKEPRVREMARDVLGLAGAELGLGMGRLVLPPGA